MADRLKEEANVAQRMNGFVRSPNEGIHPQPSICTEQHNFYYFHTAKKFYYKVVLHLLCGNGDIPLKYFRTEE